MSREPHRISTTGLYSKSSTGMVVSLVTAVTAPSQEGFTPVFILCLMTGNSISALKVWPGMTLVSASARDMAIVPSSGIPQASLTFRSNIKDADAAWTIFTWLVSSGVTWMVEDVRLVEV